MKKLSASREHRKTNEQCRSSDIVEKECDDDKMSRVKRRSHSLSQLYKPLIQVLTYMYPKQDYQKYTHTLTQAKLSISIPGLRFNKDVDGQ